MIGAGGDLRVFWSNGLVGSITTLALLLLFPTMTTDTSGVTESDAPNEPASGTRPCFYMNRTLRHWFNVQAMRNRNVLLTLNDYDGKVVQGYRQIPFRTVDQILNTETTVS